MRHATMRVGALALLACGLWACASAQEDPVSCAEGTECGAGRICVAGACVPRSRDAAMVAPDPDLGAQDALPLDRGMTPDGGPPADSAVDAAPADAAQADALPDAEPPEDAAVPVDARPDLAGADCEPGRVEDCGINRGRCRAGVRICSEAGVWGPCMGEVGPEPEVCNGADDDCNGEVDDGFRVGAPCDGVGACGEGTLECASPVATRCSTEPGGTRAQDRAERCDGADDDCDGRTDEAFDVGEACDGACGVGVLECGGEAFARCSTDVDGSQGAAGDEICDGRDQDCDGRVDEGFDVGGACQGTGACGAGVWQCTAAGRQCSSDPGGADDRSADEACNGRDDDCDGATDEGLGVGQPCQAPGACGAGVQECGGGGQLRCDVGPGGSNSRAAAEACDGLDNDCDGAVDEGLGVGDACPAVGLCPAGRLECGVGDTVVCDTRPGGARDASEPERCNDRDDDCDGQVDEALDAGEVCGGDVCGPELPTLTVDAARSGDTRGLADDHPGSACVPEATGPDQVLRFQAQAGEYVVGVAPLSPDYTPLFWVARGCDTLNQCASSLGSGREQPGRPKARRGVLGAGEHVLVVDGRAAGGGPYTASLQPFAAGETCASAIELSVPGRLVGTLDGRDNDHAGQRCPAGGLTTGADQAVRFELGGPATVRVRLTPEASWMPAVYLVRDCAQVDNTCQGSARAAAPGDALEFAAELEAGRWYVVVERPAAQQAGGEFLLELSLD